MITLVIIAVGVVAIILIASAFAPEQPRDRRRRSDDGGWEIADIGWGGDCGGGDSDGGDCGGDGGGGD